MIVIPQPRGQITLPKKLREKHGIKSGEPVKVMDTDAGIVVQRLDEFGTSEGPTIARDSYVKTIKSMSGGHWSKSDDRRLAKLRRKEKTWEIWAK